MSDLSNLSHQELVEKCQRYQGEITKLRILEAQAVASVDVMNKCADEMIFGDQPARVSAILKQCADTLLEAASS